MNYRKAKKKLTKRRNACLDKLDRNPFNASARAELVYTLLDLEALRIRKQNEK
jgi:Txe/YoeB family toxin of Txe-Axe toxin-antitoxin module